jgi:hypothetical protein
VLFRLINRALAGCVNMNFLDSDQIVPNRALVLVVQPALEKDGSNIFPNTDFPQFFPTSSKFQSQNSYLLQRFYPIPYTLNQPYTLYPSRKDWEKSGKIRVRKKLPDPLGKNREITLSGICSHADTDSGLARLQRKSNQGGLPKILSSHSLVFGFYICIEAQQAFEKRERLFLRGR